MKQLKLESRHGHSAASRRLYLRLQKMKYRNTQINSFNSANMWAIESCRNNVCTSLNNLQGIHAKCYIGLDGRVDDVTNVSVRNQTDSHTTGKELNHIPLYPIGERVIDIKRNQQTKSGEQMIDIEKKQLAELDCGAYIKVASWLEHQSQTELRYLELVEKYNETKRQEQIYNEPEDDRTYSTNRYPALYPNSRYPVRNTTLMQMQGQKNPGIKSVYKNKLPVFIIRVTDENMITEKHGQLKDTDVIDISNNVYNQLNHRIHSCLWFPCFLFFVFIFCVPALFYMNQSDQFYSRHDLHEAYLYGRMSTILYAGGLFAAFCFYSALVLCVVSFS